MKYRKRPVVIEAVQVSKDYENRMPGFWVSEVCEALGLDPPQSGLQVLADGILIQTLEGRMKAMPGDWIIKGVKGELYPVKPDIFQETYEEVE